MHFQPHAREKRRHLTLPRTHSLWKYRGGERDLCPWGQIETSFPACKKGQRLKIVPFHEASYFGTSWLFTDHAIVSSDTITCSCVMLQKNICRERIKLSTLRTGKVESQSTLLCLLPFQVEVMLYFCEQSGVCHMQGAILDIPLVSSDKTEASVAASVCYTPELPKVDIWDTAADLMSCCF